MLARTLALAAGALLCAAPSFAQGYTAPRNGYGQPDFSGAWANESLTSFERPRHYGERLVMTEDEVARIEGAANKRWEDANKPTDHSAPIVEDGRTGGYNAYWVGNNNKVMRVGGEPRTSLITT